MSSVEIYYCRSFINITYITLVLQNRVLKTLFADYEFGNILKFTRLVTELEIDIWSAYVEEATLFHSPSLRQTLCPSVLLSSHYSKLYFRGFCSSWRYSRMSVCLSCTITATSCWTTINQRTLEHTEWYPTFKEKWSKASKIIGGTITMNSNSIPTGWVSFRQKYQKFSHDCESSAPHIKEPSLQFWQRDLEFPGHPDLEGQWGLITGLPQK